MRVVHHNQFNGVPFKQCEYLRKVTSRRDNRSMLYTIKRRIWPASTAAINRESWGRSSVSLD
ncbi:hypothetical protein RE6C_02857 [Rhodopirellula europaea 6C]|uniref:Uncharacterized protein n=1 Tax=Rhodopirellula europaea 6C TaxID=1263867 RepID=M2AUY4_9BACT|nr:hypothetical protein RE6C_02857 [Rhodopirellula europaea 6C]